MKKFKVGLQLYSIREDMEKDMDSALAQVKAMGYDYVEFAGYFGKSAEEVRALLDKHGLECISVHQTYDVFLDNPKESVDYLKTIGAKYSAVPWMGVEKHQGHGDFENTVAEFNKVGKTLKDGGIQLLYHNHDFEFEKYEDKFLLDWLYDSVSEDLLKTEIDVCWVRYAGYDPAEYIRKYTGRSPIVHLKDFECKNFNMGPVYALISSDGGSDEAKKPESKDEAGFMFKPVGHGVQDIPAILAAAEGAGAEYVIVEQDSSVERPAMEAAKMSRDYLRSIGQ